MKNKPRQIKAKAESKPSPEPLLRKAKVVKTPFARPALVKFRKMLLEHKGKLSANIDQMEKESLSKSPRESSGDLSKLPIHLGDIGTDQYEQDFTIGVMEGERDSIIEINEALERIVDKTYGVCESCLKRIPVPRLNAVPQARLCIKCKEEEEKKH